MSEGLITIDNFLKKYSSTIESITCKEYGDKLKNIGTTAYWIWLTQEYHFIQHLIKCFAQCLSKAKNVTGIKTFARGIKFLSDDLELLEKKITETKQDPTSISLKPQTCEYIQYLNEIKDSDYEVLVFVNWFICYLYSKVIESNQISNIAFEITLRWKQIEFIEFMEELNVELESVLKLQSKDFENKINTLVSKIGDLEINSWKMIIKT